MALLLISLSQFNGAAGGMQGTRAAQLAAQKSDMFFPSMVAASAATFLCFMNVGAEAPTHMGRREREYGLIFAIQGYPVSLQ